MMVMRRFPGKHGTRKPLIMETHAVHRNGVPTEAKYGLWIFTCADGFEWGNVRSIKRGGSGRPWTWKKKYV